MFTFTCTLGPASTEEKVLKHLLHGADRFRLNASHLSPADLKAWLSRLQQLYIQEKRTISVAIDLQGAKMRVGKFPRVEALPEKVTLFLGRESDDASRIPLPHERLFRALAIDDELSLNDSRVQLKVTRTAADHAEATVLRNGPLSSQKGLNRGKHPLPYEELAPNDRAAIEVARDFAFTEFAFSFVHTGDEAALLRPLLPGKKIIAKLERPEALSHLMKIDARFDEHWLCRGDLGAQAGLAALGALQEDFTAAIPKLLHPPILAGQVLEHMTHFPEPTRSEIVHLHDVKKRKYAGIVLSDETAIGKNPMAVIDLLHQLR